MILGGLSGLRKFDAAVALSCPEMMTIYFLQRVYFIFYAKYDIILIERKMREHCGKG